MSMSVGKGQRNLLDIAKESARQLILAHEGKFMVFSNEAPASYEVMNQQAALNAVDRMELSVGNADATKSLHMIEGLTQDKGAIDLYYLSDFQKQQFDPAQAAALPERIHFNGVQITAPEALTNIYVDTAYLEYPSLQNDKQNRLIVRSRCSGALPKENAIVQLHLDGIVKSAAGLDFSRSKERTDTLSFEVNGSGWHRLCVSVNDLSARFDDTLYIGAKSASDLAILLVEDGVPNVFVRAALRSYPGFKTREATTNALPDAPNESNLILLSNCNQLSSAIVSKLKSALEAGVNVCILPGASVNPREMSSALKPLAAIEWMAADTIAQTASELRQEHPMIRDLFDRIPENVQLPFVRMHYPLRASTGTETQSIISFRNGDPLFAAYPSGNAQLFISSTPADPAYSNFQSSYFFVPFVYQMASLSQSADIYSVFAGQAAPVFVPTSQNSGSQRLLLRGNGADLIPAQRPQGRGMLLDLGKVLSRSGFYYVSSEHGDSSLIGANLNRMESDLSYWELTDLKNRTKRKGDSWQSADAENPAVSKHVLSSFPLWKLCSILALGMLGLEIYLLSRKHFRKNTITN